MLAARIQQDLFNFIENDPEDIEGLLLFWYMANSLPLSASLGEDSGIKLMVNISDFNGFENVVEKPLQIDPPWPNQIDPCCLAKLTPSACAN